MMVSVPEKVGRFIKESILVIAKFDFPKGWPYLITTLMNYLNINHIEDPLNAHIFKLLTKLTAK